MLALCEWSDPECSVPHTAVVCLVQRVELFICSFVHSISIPLFRAQWVAPVEGTPGMAGDMNFVLISIIYIWNTLENPSYDFRAPDGAQLGVSRPEHNILSRKTSLI